tara:strand:- start:114 stop:314 length:201 start_codon:yes stop_codon:yes gene_type:complete
LEKTKEKESIMAKGVKHYFKNGKEHKGATHKDAKGRVMSGARHTDSSKFLVHMKDLSATAKKMAKK